MQKDIKMDNLPGYDFDKRNQIAKMVNTPFAVGALSGSVTCGLCGAVMIWLVRNYAEDLNGIAGAYLFLLVCMCGAVMGVLTCRHICKRMGINLWNKLQRGDKLNRLNQWQLEHLFSAGNIAKLSEMNDGLFRNLCEGSLSHISYDAAINIMDGHLKHNPTDYAKVVEKFNKESLPKYIRERYSLYGK